MSRKRSRSGRKGPKPEPSDPIMPAREPDRVHYHETQAESLIRRFGPVRAREHKSWPKVPEKVG